MVTAPWLEWMPRTIGWLEEDDPSQNRHSAKTALGGRVHRRGSPSRARLSMRRDCPVQMHLTHAEIELQKTAVGEHH